MATIVFFLILKLKIIYTVKIYYFQFYFFLKVYKTLLSLKIFFLKWLPKNYWFLKFRKKNLHADINFFYFSFQIREERANLTALKVLSNVNRGWKFLISVDLYRNKCRLEFFVFQIFLSSEIEKLQTCVAGSVIGAFKKIPLCNVCSVIKEVHL